LDVRGACGGDPPIVAALDRAPIDEHPDDLFDEERIALGLREDVLARLLRQRLEVQQVRHERPRVLSRQRIELDLDERVPEEIAYRGDEAPALALAVEARRRD